MSRTYITIQGDTWDLISQKEYGSDKHTHILLDNNRGLVETIVFYAGVEIVIPDLEVQTVNTSIPPWRR